MPKQLAHRSSMFPELPISSRDAYKTVVGYGRIQASKGRSHPEDANDLESLDRDHAAQIIEATFYLTTGAYKAAWYRGAREWCQENTPLPFPS